VKNQNGISLRGFPYMPSTMDDPMYLGRNIRRMGNHIYFYDEVDEETQLIFFQLMREATTEILSEHVREILTNQFMESIVIHINSPGGDAYSGLALYDFIKSSQIPVTTIVEGIAASAASLLFLAGGKRAMTQNSTVMIHQCSWGGYGTDAHMKDTARSVESIMRKMVRIYANETLLGAQLTDPKQRKLYLDQLLEHDTYLDYAECEKFGFLQDCDCENELSEQNQEAVEKYVEELLKKQIEEKEAKKAGKTVEKTPAKETSKKKKSTEKESTPKKAPTKKAAPKEESKE
jgi:ATP-dependent Clp endopeptidase proteolytic subunit ClpP